MRLITTASSVSCGDVCYEADEAGVLDIAAEHIGLFAHQIAAGVLVVAPEETLRGSGGAEEQGSGGAEGEPDDAPSADPAAADDHTGWVATEPAARKPAKKKAK